MQIGAPYEVRDEKGREHARCPVSLEGLHDQVSDIEGEDTFQALTLAVGFVREALQLFVDEGVKIYFDDGETEFEFGPYFVAYET